MNRPRLPQRGDEGGFTVVELIIAMIILGIIMAPLTSAFFIGVGTTKTSSQAVANSSDAQLLSAFFADDVASADTVSTGTACGGSNTVIEFRSQDGSIDRRVAYTVSVDSGAIASLHVGTAYRLNRAVCESGGPAVRVPLARSMKATPTIVCGGVTSCPAAAADPQPRTVTMTFAEYGAQAPDRPRENDFFVTVNGTRRVTK